MAKRPAPQVVVPDLTVREWLLLFCVASETYL